MTAEQFSDRGGRLEKFADMIGRALRSARLLGERGYAHVEPNLFASGIFGAIAFPVYYVVWKLLFPQAYEDLSLRVIGSLLCLILAFKNHWPRELHRYHRAYYLFTLSYCLPFFFTLMTLKNGGSDVWVFSLLGALFLLVLMVDWLHMLLVFAAGSGFAWGVHLATASGKVEAHLYFEHFPIFIFMITAGMVFNYKAELIRQERMKAVSEATSSVSSELRVPLQIIRTGAIGLRKYLPELDRGYRLARQHGLPVLPMDDQHLDALAGVPERVETEIEHALAVTSMLIMNSGELPIDSEEMKACSMRGCVDLALRRYPFRSEREQARVIWRKGRDFEFIGAENLMVHVLLNLFKNALESVSAKGQGNVYLELLTDGEYNSILVRDTGNGLPPLVLNQLLSQKAVHGTETLRGTSFRFCSMVAEAFGGKISAESVYGKFTSIAIRLPALQPEADSAGGENQQEDSPLAVTA